MSLFENNNQSFEQLRREFRWRIPEYYNIGEDVCDRHGARADQTALFLEDSAGRAYTVTFGELKTRSDRFANALRGLGVGRGDRVAIILPQREETVIVGDRMDTDIIAGLHAEIASVLVLSGVTDTEDLKHFAYHPHCVLDGVGDIPEPPAP